ALLRDGEARPREGGQPLVALGPPLPGFALSIRDGEGRELREGRLGRVFVSGPSLMQGYHGLPEATAQALRDGWLDTGDSGLVLEGELFLFGRAKDAIVLRGRNHAPQDVEQAVDGVPGARVGCCAAVGMLAEDGSGEELVVFVERARGAARDDAGLAREVA